ncbi:hypothetical protein B0A55_04803 [Friedmanniomyces simplex]|uniref:Uncharacterized protein n=1 Tax=Friedmanniomyces simplex TaxID=329884 RepID=A0A4U0XFL6_9PEZI|nr:hypothetical protein B0A55_04803 [Friedmanniomyces simplex]
MAIEHKTPRPTHSHPTAAKLEKPSFAAVQRQMAAIRYSKAYPLPGKLEAVRKENVSIAKRNALKIISRLKNARSKFTLLANHKLRCTCPSGLHIEERDRYARVCRMVPYGVSNTIAGLNVGYETLTEDGAFAAWYETGHRGPALPYNEARRVQQAAEGKAKSALFGRDVAEDLRWRGYVDRVGSEVVQQTIWCMLTMKG